MMTANDKFAHVPIIAATFLDALYNFNYEPIN